MMKVKASVDLPVTLVSSGIQVGDTLIAWSLLLENPDIRASLRQHLDTVESVSLELSAKDIGRIAMAAPHVGSSGAAVASACCFATAGGSGSA